jgi:hypothetical protein
MAASSPIRKMVRIEETHSDGVTRYVDYDPEVVPLALAQKALAESGPGHSLAARKSIQDWMAQQHKAGR